MNFLSLISIQFPKNFYSFWFFGEPKFPTKARDEEEK